MTVMCFRALGCTTTARLLCATQKEMERYSVLDLRSWTLAGLSVPGIFDAGLDGASPLYMRRNTLDLDGSDAISAHADFHDNSHNDTHEDSHNDSNNDTHSDAHSDFHADRHNDEHNDAD